MKRGQSVEFADYRDYALGDDLRQLDWNVYARLEKLFVKLFVEEEDVTITFLLDARPVDGLRAAREAAVREAGRRGPRVHRARRRGPRRASRALTGRTARRQGGLRGSGRVFRLLANLSAIQPVEGPTDLLASARHAGAQLSGRGVVVLLSDLLDPAADSVIRELAATGSELIVLHILSPDELDPPLEGDLRLVDSETGEGIDVTVDLATLDDYKARLAAWQDGFADLAAKRRASYVPLSSDVPLADLVFAELRRRRVRRLMSFLAPLALAGLAFLPVVLAMYLLKLRRDEAVVPSTLLWRALVADVEANAPWQRLRRSLLLLLQLLLVAILAILAARPFVERPAGLAGDLVLVVDTSASMQATDVTPTRLDAAKAAAVDALKDLPAGGKVSVIAAGRDGAGHRERHGGPGAREAGDRVDHAQLRHRRPRRRAAARLRARGPLRRRRDPRRHRCRARDAARRDRPRGARPRPPGGPRGEQPGDRRARRPDPAEQPLAQRVRLDREPGPRARRAPDRGLRRRHAARGAHGPPRPPAPHRRRRSTTSTTRTGRPRSSRSGSRARTRPRPARRDPLASTIGRGRSSRRPVAAPDPARRATATRTSRPRSPTCPTPSCTA